MIIYDNVWINKLFNSVTVDFWIEEGDVVDWNYRVVLIICKYIIKYNIYNIIII